MDHHTTKTRFQIPQLHCPHYNAKTAFSNLLTLESVFQKIA